MLNTTILRIPYEQLRYLSPIQKNLFYDGRMCLKVFGRFCPRFMSRILTYFSFRKDHKRR
jgi:hypothetical protein